MKTVVGNNASQGAKVACLTFLSELLQSGAKTEWTTKGCAEIHAEVSEACSQTFGVAKKSLECCGSLAWHLEEDDHKERVFQSVHTQFMRNDLNGDIKEAAITAMGHCVVADPRDLRNIETRLDQQLDNEVTRSAAVVAIGLIANGNQDISYILSNSMNKIKSLTRQVDKGIRHKTLETLWYMCKSAYGQLSAGQMDTILQMLADKVSLKELKDTQLVLQATSALVLSRGAECATRSQGMLLGGVCDCLRSDAFQGSALTAALQYVAALVTSGCDSRALVRQLVQTQYAPAGLKKANSGLSRVASFSGNGASKNLAMAIGAVTREAGAAVGNEIAVSMMQESNQIFALYAIGEVTVGSVGEVSGLQQFITTHFGSDDEAVLFAAAFALGCLCVGNPSKYIPYVIELLHGPANKVVVLTAVQEAVQRCIDLSKEDLLIPYIDSTLLPALMEVSGSDNESAVRKSHGCLGRLLQMAPEQVMPAIESYATGDMPARVAAFSCLKYYVSRELESDSLVIPRAIEMVAVGLGNAEPANWAEGDEMWPQKIRLASIQSFTAMLSRPAYIRGVDSTRMAGILKLISNELEFKKTVVEVFGKEKMHDDKALENRVAAFDCMRNALDLLEDKLNVEELLSTAVLACNDEEWQKGQSIESRCCALELVNKIISKQPGLVSDFVGDQAKPPKKDRTFIAALYRGFFDLRLVRTETPEDEGALWAFILALRKIFADFKQVEPNHAVFPAIDDMLSARRKTWATSKAESSQELAKMVDKYNHEGGAAADGAGGEC